MEERNSRVTTADWRARVETKLDRLIQAETERRVLEGINEKSFNLLEGRVTRMEERTSILTAIQFSFATLASIISGYIATRLR